MLKIETTEEYARLNVLSVMLRLWIQLEREWCSGTSRRELEGELHHWGMRAQEDAGELLENEGFVTDDGDSFNITDLGRDLLRRFD